jgi:hypothetical protein
VEEGDALALGAEPGRLIDEADTGGAAAVQCAFDVVDGETDVMEAGAALGDELADGRIAGICLE